MARSPGGSTLTQIDAFVPSTGKVLDAGLLPQAVAFAGYATVGIGPRSPSATWSEARWPPSPAPTRPGSPRVSLQSVISLRPSRYGGPAGRPGPASPYSGTLLIADRGNDRLLALDANRNITWQYPSATMPPPPGGFYFPDDAFFIKGGTGIISNQEDNHTIVEIGYPSGKILWQYGHPGQPGSAPGYLNQPDDAYLLKSGTVTVADASNNRILFISPAGPGHRADRQRGRRPQPAHLHRLPQRRHAAGRRRRPGLGDQRLVGRRVHADRQAGVDRAHADASTTRPIPSSSAPDLYLMTDYDPPAEGRDPRVHPAGPDHLDL